MRIETTEADARQVCTVMVNRLTEKKRFFGGGWKLRILAPEQAQKPLAECALP